MRERPARSRADGGLHFDADIFAALAARRVRHAFVTLHVGAGTFQPVRAEDIERHQMHTEYLEVRQATCDAINSARAAGGRVIAVGTTVVRSLETAAAPAAAEAPRRSLPRRPRGRCRGARAGAAEAPAPRCRAQVGALAGSARGIPGPTRLFIKPGFRFRAVDAMVTNFHLPESTLLMLCAAFVGRETLLAAYAHAVRSVSILQLR